MVKRGRTCSIHTIHQATAALFQNTEAMERPITALLEPRAIVPFASVLSQRNRAGASMNTPPMLLLGQKQLQRAHTRKSDLHWSQTRGKVRRCAVSHSLVVDNGPNMAAPISVRVH